MPALLHRIAAVLALCALPVAALADRAEQMQTLLDALRIDDTVQIMRAEGIIYGTELAQHMIPDADGGGWAANVGRIYDADRMQSLVETGLTSELEGVDVAPLAAFFASDLGRRIVELELSAREAFIEQDIEDAAKDLYAQLAGEGAELIDQVDVLIEDSDLVNLNVMGILNSQLMLYRGLADGGAYEMTEEDILNDVWSQEQTVREDSLAWIGAYLMMAYQPLDHDEVERYAALWRTEEGRALNRALFAVYDRMYEELNYLLGQAMAQHMRSQKL